MINNLIEVVLKQSLLSTIIYLKYNMALTLECFPVTEAPVGVNSGPPTESPICKLGAPILFYVAIISS